MSAAVNSRVPPFLLSLSLALLAPLATSAQTEPPPADSFGEVIDVALVNVEVWVTDSEGRPVVGLTADDFEVLEDGEVVPITFFSEVGAAARERSTTAPTAGTAGDPELPTGEPPGHWVFYFDQLHLSGNQQKRLVKEIRDFLPLSGIAPDRVLILRQDRELAVEANFGSSREELERALARLAEERPARGQLRANAKRLAIDQLQQIWDNLEQLSIPNPCDAFPSRALPEVNRYARQAAERTALTLGNLDLTASFLTGVPGVKTMVYAGDALETHPGRDLLRFIRELCPAHTDAGRFQLAEGLGERFRRLTREANANRVTIYTLQTGGLRANTLMGAEQRSLENLAMARNVLGPSLRESERSGLEYLADDTGGRALLNRNRFEEALEEIAREMSSYYSLAYEPPNAGEGREHRIEVRLPDSDLSARHRLNYRDQSPRERLVDRLQSALFLGLSDNPLALRLGAGDVTLADGERYSLRLHLLVPAGEVVFLPHEESSLARLEATVAVRSPSASSINLVERELPVPAPPMGDEALLDLVVPVEVGSGPQLLAVALRDRATNETSIVSTAVEIQAPAAPGG